MITEKPLKQHGLEWFQNQGFVCSQTSAKKAIVFLPLGFNATIISAILSEKAYTFPDKTIRQ
jgi:hypothetical protein